MHTTLNGPQVGKGCYIHPTARIIGNVRIGNEASVWLYSVLRGDEERISIGNRTNIQDGVIIHVDHDYPTSIGDEVTIGHGAIVHGCKIGNGCIIGIRSTVLNGAEISDGCIIGAGAVVTPETVIPENSMVLGIPGKVKRTDEKFRDMAKRNAEIYVDLARSHSKGVYAIYNSDEP